ncbi:PAQR family membrane homeostasis protein TrhA [Nocardioides dongxiaopingii]|uniref:PAQR family membrane homeostasis protein TrhA n=1 Tax=Nocardioides sp. S-1144 TaxID=2582905 RepID=UPI0021CB35DD|nr:hemolysin III family protein [Nocardioides sp. S-1144]
MFDGVVPPGRDPAVRAPLRAATAGVRLTLKPRFRGWSHAGFSPVVLVAGVVLVCLAPTAPSRWAAAAYSVAGVTMFAVSAIFNVGTWGARGQAILRRMDHGSIYLIIAGTYTPIATLALDGVREQAFLVGAWVAAALGVVFRTLWLNAPRALYTSLYVALGWSIAPFVGDLFATSAAAGALTLLGGVLYTIGGVVYGTRRPDPSPTHFGFHEVFHAFTVGAWICQYIAISILTYQA